MPNEVESITALVTAVADNRCQIVEHPDGRTFAFRHKDFVLDSLTPANQQPVLMPKLVTQSVRVSHSVSLVEYVNRFKNADSVLFADIECNAIIAAIDYHKVKEDGVAAQLNKHVVALDLPYSEEWAAWIGRNEKLMTHVDFASFLEEHASDVVDPNGADLFEMLRDINVRQDSFFTASIRMGDTVQVTFQKNEETTNKDLMALPAEFRIQIPIYRGEGLVVVRCMMRRKVADGHLSLGYKMMRIETTRQDEFNRLVRRVMVETELPAYYGSI